MSMDAAIRLAAGLAAVALVASPLLVAAAGKAKAWWDARPSAPAPTVEGVSLADMRLVLDLAARLKSAGCDAGVALCQQLLDVMLSPGKVRK